MSSKKRVTQSMVSRTNKADLGSSFNRSRLRRGDVDDAEVPHNKLLQLTLDCDLPSLPLRSAPVKCS